MALVPLPLILGQVRVKTYRYSEVADKPEKVRDRFWEINHYMGKVGVVVDVSNAHGEMYCVVFPVPDRDKHIIREMGVVKAVWFEPEELENVK